MKTKAEVIAMVMPDNDASGRAQHTATLLLRNPDGQMSLQTVSTESTIGQYAMSTGCFRKGKPIFDPVTRQVLGHEMEMIPSPQTAFA
jgi:hypothetical protein